MDLEDFLAAMIQGLDEKEEVQRIRTFEDAGVMTHNDGLVVELKNGNEYQVTVMLAKKR